MKRYFTIFIIVLIVGGSVGLYKYHEYSKKMPEGLIQVNGRLEADRTLVASQVSGRVMELLVAEGDSVSKGNTLARLDDNILRTKVSQARAAYETALAQVTISESQLDTLREEVPKQISIAESGVSYAKAILEKAGATEKQARRDVERYEALFEKGAVDAQTVERYELTWKSSTDELQAASSSVAQAEQQLLDAQLGPERIITQEAQVAALISSGNEAEARLAESETNYQELTVVSPASGVITTKIVDLGEVINIGMPLYEVIDLDSIYLKVYVPEIEIGKVRLGLPAQIYTDAFPDQPFMAEVRTIASQAEFTPKEVQTPDERVKLVYAVKLYLLENPNHKLTPGLPADAVIRWKQDVEWTKPRW